MKPHFNEVRDEGIFLNFNPIGSYSNVIFTDALCTSSGRCGSRLSIESKLQRKQKKQYLLLYGPCEIHNIITTTLCCISMASVSLVSY